MKRTFLSAFLFAFLLTSCANQIPIVVKKKQALAPLAPVPRLPAQESITAGDLFRLTLDLYEYAGDCRRRANALLSEDGPIEQQ